MENMLIYDAVRSVPENAKREIAAGRLKGKTDINPMWRIKALTEQFGPCGFGWKYVIRREWMEHGANDEIAAFVDIDLYYKLGGEWSEAIPGTGGSSFVSSERSGPYTSDECFKMALTDAISVACKAIGMGADVYWDKDITKYTGRVADPAPHGNDVAQTCSVCGKVIKDAKNNAGEIWKAADIAVYTKHRLGQSMCVTCMNKAMKAEG